MGDQVRFSRANAFVTGTYPLGCRLVGVGLGGVWCDQVWISGASCFGPRPGALPLAIGMTPLWGLSHGRHAPPESWRSPFYACLAVAWRVGGGPVATRSGFFGQFVSLRGLTPWGIGWPVMVGGGYVWGMVGVGAGLQRAQVSCHRRVACFERSWLTC